MKSSLIIPGELVSMNEYINAERSNRYIAASIKKQQTALVSTYCHKQRMKKITEPLEEILIYWYTKDTRKDADNVQASTKFLLDGLVQAGVLPNDNRKFVNNIKHFMYVDKVHPRIEIELW